LSDQFRADSKTNEFKKKVDEIKKELTDKYSLTILNEKNG